MDNSCPPLAGCNVSENMIKVNWFPNRSYQEWLLTAAVVWKKIHKSRDIPEPLLHMVYHVTSLWLRFWQLQGHERRWACCSQTRCKLQPPYCVKLLDAVSGKTQLPKMLPGVTPDGNCSFGKKFNWYTYDISDMITIILLLKFPTLQPIHAGPLLCSGQPYCVKPQSAVVGKTQLS